MLRIESERWSGWMGGWLDGCEESNGHPQDINHGSGRVTALNPGGSTISRELLAGANVPVQLFLGSERCYYLHATAR